MEVVDVKEPGAARLLKSFCMSTGRAVESTREVRGVYFGIPKILRDIKSGKGFRPS